MGNKKTTFHILDMTCKSCETRIGQTLKAKEGVIAVAVSLENGRAEVDYDEEKTTPETLKAAIEKIGYTVGEGGKKGTALAIGAGILLAALYMLANALGLFNAFPGVNASLGYGMLFIVGLLTSVHCIAMCGGIALSQSLSDSNLRRTTYGKLKPGIQYNSGRVVAYTLVGGLAGALGAAFSFSPVAKGIIAATAGAFMILFGLKMLGVLKKLPRFSGLLPAPLKGAANRFSAALGKRGPFAVGLLNGLMPCGPLQTMQLYALGTGSLFAGALSMFIFSVGTVPLMLSFGIAAALLPKKAIPIMVKASAILVIFLGLITLGRAAALSGMASVQNRDWTEGRTTGGPIKATIQDNVQTVLTDFGDSGYYMPFVVQAGIPVKWTIRVKEDGLNGCNNPITIPSYRIKKTLVPGDNLIEFTPRQTGTITYTCWMGMISSRITVTENLSTLP